jgi:cationic peptide transport system ATP-binding protein
MGTLLEVRQLAKSFRYKTGLFQHKILEAVKPVSFTLKEKQTLAIIGENGSGKSTLAKMLAGMIKPSSGEIFINEQPLTFGDYKYRSQQIRMIFQNPNTSFNPRQQIGELLDTPLKLHTLLDPHEREQQIYDTLRQVGLTKEHAFYYPAMLASGQKQRVAFARALILKPQIIIADEALTALDMSIRSQIINLMLELQENLGISYIYVTQHLGMMKHISDQVLVMQAGEVVERGNAAEVLAAPLHDLTRRLIASHFEETLKADLWRKDDIL